MYMYSMYSDTVGTYQLISSQKNTHVIADSIAGNGAKTRKLFDFDAH